MTKRKKRLLPKVPKLKIDTEKYFHNPHPLLKAGFVFVGIGLFAIGATLLWVAFAPAPDFESFINRKISLSTKIYDRTGETVLYDLNTDVKRTSVPLADISPYIQKAAISIEDSNFYHHGGVSFTAIIRSLIKDVLTGSFAQGGSTITQQVVKLTVLTSDKSIVRKVHEWVLAWKLENTYSKDQILELYLNDVPYGGTLYGAEAAARAFYGKSAKDVDLAQAAYLAGMPQSPTFYSPYGNNRAALDTRKNLVLARMKELGYITADEYANAKAEVVTFRPQQYGTIIAPHFVFFIRQYLEQKYGADVVTQGLTVQTTLDADLQQDAETIVSQYGASNVGKFHASNAALVAIDPKTGQILAMVGSRDYFNTDIQGNYNIALASRQPGSAFKPFVYAAALQKGYTPQTAVFDVPTQFSTACSPSDVYNDTPPCYAPQNYDNKFRGAMTFTTALAQSINVPAVKVLYLAGIKNVISLAQSAGIDTLGDANHYGLTLALGAAEVPLLKLTNAYGVFADNGVYNPPVGILKVTDSKGNVLEEYQPQPSAVLDPGVAHDVTYMLSNNDARQPEYPPVNPFYFPGHDVAAKTGTTNDSRDAWTVGYTPNIVVGTWAGNNDNTPMVKEIAGYIVAPMWNAFMRKAIDKYPVEYFEAPRTVSDTAPAILRGNYMSNGVPHDILFWVNRDNPQLGGSSTGDAQYPYWEYSVGGWGGTGTVTVPGSSAENSTTTQ